MKIHIVINREHILTRVQTRVQTRVLTRVWLCYSIRWRQHWRVSGLTNRPADY